MDVRFPLSEVQRKLMEDILSKRKTDITAKEIPELGIEASEFIEEGLEVTRFKPNQKTCEIARMAYCKAFLIGVVVEENGASQANGNGKIIGTIGRSDLLNKMNEVLIKKKSSVSEEGKEVCPTVCDLAKLTARDYARKDFFYASCNEKVADVIKKISENRAYRIIVLDSNSKCRGIITPEGIVRKLQERWASLNGELTVKIFELWVNNHPKKEDKTLFVDEESYSPEDILREMREGSNIGKQFKEYFQEIIKDKCKDAKSLSEYIQALVELTYPPAELRHLGNHPECRSQTTSSGGSHIEVDAPPVQNRGK